MLANEHPGGDGDPCVGRQGGADGGDDVADQHAGESAGLNPEPGPLRTRLQLSRAKHRSLAGHARWSRRFAALVPFYEYGESEFFAADSAPAFGAPYDVPRPVAG